MSDQDRTDEAALAWVKANAGAPVLGEQGSIGAPANLVDNLGSPEGVISLIGSSLRALHDTPIDDAPIRDGWDATADLIDDRLNSGLLDPAALPDPYGRYSAARLVEMWRESRPDLGDGESIVLCHGAPSLDNIVVDRTELVGFVDTGRLCLADRHLDLAIVHNSLQTTIGGEAAFIFYDAYGIDPNVLRLDHYLFAALLVG